MLTPDQLLRSTVRIFADWRDNHSVSVCEIAELGLFRSGEEKYIQRAAERLLYEPKLPWAGHKERSWVAKLDKLARRTDWGGHGRAAHAARKWTEVYGWYYIRRPLTSRENKADYEWFTMARDAAERSEEWDLKWFAQMMLDGLPVAVADFKLECHFLLERADGHIDRMVKLRNVKGETTALIPMDSEAFHAPQKFRKWCLDHGNYHWCAGEKELQHLHVDTGRANAYRKVKQIVEMGSHILSIKRGPEGLSVKQLWFARDAVYTNEGTLLRADEDGIYWHDEIGYMLSDSGRDNRFHQGGVFMHPDAKLADAQLALLPQFAPAEPGELPLLRGFYREVCHRLRRTVGSLDAHLMIGWVFSFMAGTEIFEEKNEFTGMWVHGSKESGKSTVCGWLTSFHAMNRGRKGMTLRGKTNTATGFAETLDQYSNIMVWADEFRQNEVDADKLSVLHQTYNRGGGAKWSPTKLQREVRTNFLVSGESTTGDAALMGRYMHIQMSKEAREKNEDGSYVPHEAWFEQHRQHFFHFARFILQRRSEFVATLMKILKTWNETPGLTERTKTAYGVPYAAFVAMSALLESHGGADLVELKRHTIVAAANAAADVSAETNINVFLVDMITAFKAGELDIGYFRVKSQTTAHAPGRPNQKGWTSYELWWDPDQVLSDLQRFLTQRRSSVVLNRKDLRDQLSREPYWIHASKAMRFLFGGTERNAKAWGIRIDDLPVLGYCAMSDEARDEWMSNPDDSAVDPRKGNIYAIVEAVKAKEDELKRGMR